jgi:hypothetical protein
MSPNCANPDCGKPYTNRKGRLFRFHEGYPTGKKPVGVHSVRHFWLCELCSRTYSLVYRNGRCKLIEKESSPLLKTMVNSARG